MRSASKFILPACAIIVLLATARCGEDKPTGPDGIMGTPPDFLAGIWSLEHFTWQTCLPLSELWPTGATVDTICHGRRGFESAHFERIARRIRLIYSRYAVISNLECTGTVTETLINIACQCSVTYTGGTCVFAISTRTYARPDTAVWTLKDRVDSWYTSPCGGLNPGDTVKSCRLYKSVFTRIADAPDPCVDGGGFSGGDASLPVAEHFRAALAQRARDSVLELEEPESSDVSYHDPAGL